MKDKFSEFYRPTDKEFENLWNDCIFTFDSNVLLNLYMYSEEARETFFEVLKNKKIIDRIWLSHQAGLEYQEHRLTKINEQKRIYNVLCDVLERSLKKIEEAINSLKEHPIIDLDTMKEKIKKDLSSIIKKIRKEEEKHPKWSYDYDPIRDEIDKLFINKVGKPFSEVDLENLYKEGKERYDNDVPPGYKDKGKPENEYGDLILWKQIIGKAKELKTPFILVTDDLKEDWWSKIGKGKISPRPELIRDFREEANVLFYIYSTDRFLEYAQEKYLKEKVDKKSIEEIKRKHEFKSLSDFLSDSGILKRQKEMMEFHSKLKLPELPNLMQLDLIPSGFLKMQGELEKTQEQIREMASFYADGIKVDSSLGKSIEAYKKVAKNYANLVENLKNIPASALYTAGSFPEREESSEDQKEENGGSKTAGSFPQEQ